MKKFLLCCCLLVSELLLAQKPSYSGSGGIANTTVPKTVQTVASNANIAAWNTFVLIQSANTVSITLPPANAADVGKQIWIKSVSSGLGSVQAAGSDSFYSSTLVYPSETRIYEVTAVGVVHEITTTERQIIYRGNSTSNYSFSASETQVADVLSIQQTTANLAISLAAPIASPQKVLTVQNRESSTQAIVVEGITIGVGQSQAFTFAGASWRPLGAEKMADYVYARLTNTTTTINAARDVSGYSATGGNIVVDATGTTFTLEAGKTYQLTARFQAAAWIGTNPYAVIQWVDATTNNALVAFGGMAMLLPPAATNSPTPIPIAELIYTPTVTQTVKLRVLRLTGSFSLFAANNGSNVGSTDVSIIQVGNSPVVRQARVVVLAGLTVAATIPNAATTDITNWTEAKDTHGALNNGIFTAPRTGDYAVQFSLAYSSFTIANPFIVSAELRGSASRNVYLSLIQNQDPGNTSIVNTSVVRLNQGESIRFSSFQNSGAARTLLADAARNYLSIYELEPNY